MKMIRTGVRMIKRLNLSTNNENDQMWNTYNGNGYFQSTYNKND